MSGKSEPIAKPVIAGLVAIRFLAAPVSFLIEAATDSPTDSANNVWSVRLVVKISASHPTHDTAFRRRDAWESDQAATVAAELPNCAMFDG